MNTRLRLFFFLWFYIGWFGCVLLGRGEWGVLAFVFPIVSLVGLAFAKILSMRILMAMAGLIGVGLLFDGVLAAMGAVRFSHPTSFFLPAWLIALWILFVAALPVLQPFLGPRPFLAAILGAILGPLSYRAGEPFGVLFFTSLVAPILMAGFWALYFPFSLRLLPLPLPDRSTTPPGRKPSHGTS